MTTGELLLDMTVSPLGSTTGVMFQNIETGGTTGVGGTEYVCAMIGSMDVTEYNISVEDTSDIVVLSNNDIIVSLDDSVIVIEDTIDEYKGVLDEQ